MSNEYRYGYNGKEFETSLGSDSYDYGFRCYDARVSRFLSVDPLTFKFPWYTPFQFAGNKPIQSIDIDGLEDVHYSFLLLNNGDAELQITDFRNTEERHGPAGSGFIQIDYIQEFANGDRQHLETQAFPTTQLTFLQKIGKGFEHLLNNEPAAKIPISLALLLES